MTVTGTSEHEKDSLGPEQQWMDMVLFSIGPVGAPLCAPLQNERCPFEALMSVSFNMVLLPAVYVRQPFLPLHCTSLKPCIV